MSATEVKPWSVEAIEAMAPSVMVPWEAKSAVTMKMLLDRVKAMSEVDCVKDWGKRPMKCLPKDKCSFCRARDTLMKMMVLLP